MRKELKTILLFPRDNVIFRISDTSFSEIQINNWTFSDILSPDENFGLSLIFDTIDSSNLEIKNTIFDNLKTRISFQIDNSSVIFYKY